MVIGIRLTVDFAFKLVFGSPEHTSVTIHFLNAILRNGPRITDVRILNPFLEKEFEEDKLSVLDILATDEHGCRLNIEMQTTIPAGMAQRLTYYAARMYVGQLIDGAAYTGLRPAISICVLSKALFPDVPGLHLDFRLRESSGRLLTDDLQVHLLELPKLGVTLENIRMASPIERWASFLQNAHTLTREDVVRLFPDREFAEAAGVLEMISQTPEQQRLYDAQLKFQLDAAARLELARDEGRVEGLREGEEKGLRAGKEIGQRKGELLGRIAVLQELLGVTDPDRSELPNLELEQLSELTEQLQQRLRQRGQ